MWSATVIASSLEPIEIDQATAMAFIALAS